MELFSLSLLAFIITSVMLFYFAIARAPSEASEDTKQADKQGVAQASPRGTGRKAVGAAVSVDFVRRDSAQRQEYENIHPVLRQNVVVARMMQSRLG